MRTLVLLVAFALVACASVAGIVTPSASSAQRADVVKHSQWDPIAWSNQTPFVIFPSVNNAGGCWAQTSYIDPVPAWRNTIAVPVGVIYDAQTCGKNPLPFTVTWGKQAFPTSGCEFQIQYLIAHTGSSPYAYSTADQSLACSISHYYTKGGASITLVTIKALALY